MMKLLKNILLTTMLTTAGTIGRQQEAPLDIQQPKISQEPQEPTSQTMISFNYDNEELVNVINYIASKRGTNLLLPVKADEKIVGKLTWHLDKKVTIDEAWNLLGTILNIAGYSIAPRKSYDEIVKTTREISRQPMPLYIGIPPEQLPATDQRIRYLYYLANIKTEGETENEISPMLKAILPSDALFKIDSATNALILMGKANDIKSAMSVVTHLDQPGFQETMEVIRLKHTEAQLLADLFNNNILQKTETNRYRLDTQKKSDISYFSKHIKIIAQGRTNSLIVLGRAQSVTRIREFINHYIDVEQDSGKSILHVYQLQYRNASSFAEVLKNIVQPKEAGGFEQATGEGKAVTGPQRYFEDVLISVDTPEGQEGEDETAWTGEEGTPSTTIMQTKYFGGNKLIIAARNDDWQRLKELIEKLDEPEPQVLIEVLIADLTLDDTKALGTLFRNPEKLPMPGATNFQSAHLLPGVMTDSFDAPNTVGVIERTDGSVEAASDLLRFYGTDETTGKRKDSGTENVATNLTKGSTAISFNDSSGKTWGITQILKLIDNTKILSHPHIISTNNKEAKIEISETRRLTDQASGSQGGTVISTDKDIPASLIVKIVPRISISETRDNTVNLQVLIDINEFKSATDDTRITRNVTTNATVVTGDILALGGLVRTNETDAVSETPLLSKIPLIGWLFKKRSKIKKQTNLTVFISPTIIEPRLRGGIGTYTKDYLSLTREYAKSGDLFDSLKDPITRWFFTEESATEKFTKEFMSEDEITKNKTPMPTNNPNDTKRLLTQTNQEQPKNIVIEQQKEQMEQLKSLFQGVDNPFENLKKPTAAA